MKNRLIGLLFAGITLTACQPGTEATEEEPSLYERLSGTWETTYLKVDVQTADNQPDSSYIFEVKEGEWERLYRVKPHRTYFAPDSTFRTVHRSIPGEVMSQEKGLWNTFGDTLMMIQPNTTQQFKVSVDKGMGHFIGLVDFDGDGREDDSYYAIRRYVGRNSYE